jgi:hypothetical protein
MSQYQFSPTDERARNELTSDFGRCLSSFLALGANDGQERDRKVPNQPEGEWVWCLYPKKD